MSKTSIKFELDPQEFNVSYSNSENLAELVGLILMFLNGDAYSAILEKLQQDMKDGILSQEDYLTIIKSVEVGTAMIDEQLNGKQIMRPSEVFGGRPNE